MIIWMGESLRDSWFAPEAFVMASNDLPTAIYIVCRDWVR